MTESAHPDPAVPGVDADEALVARLTEALEAKGEDYEPRTEHLEADGSPTYTNRLILEGSPYLLQHAHNPVNWFAWGDEAFERAKALDRPVFLSVGYSTCHWCHVMERESFEDEEIARFINEHFVPIKVDREERPDVDSLYMTAVQLLTRRGGWPMTVVMTPEGEPFFGGTYFPARDGDRGAHRGFLSILRQLSTAYAENRDEVLEDAARVSQRMQEVSRPRPPADVPGEALIAQTSRQLMRGFDPRHGGWGRAPKFPQPSRLGLLLRFARRSGDADAREQVTKTLHAMADGGLRDHVGGGFHRYSTDAHWLVPHFEKMLYDNAQLVVAYLEGWQLTGEARFREVALETLRYLLREMQAPAGGFYSATDADSPTPSGEREEGWFFTWTPDELAAVLPAEDAEWLGEVHGVTPRGNFEGRSILFLPNGPTDDPARLEAAHQKLYAARADRPPPLRDDKVVTSWNGLTISAFARGALATGDDSLAAVGIRAADHALRVAVDADGRLVRRVLGGDARQRAFLEDYAFLIRGLLDLHEATGETRWLTEARRLQAEQDRLFGDEAGGYWRSPSDGEALLLRDKPGDDGAIPSGNAIAADNLLRLAALGEDAELQQRAERLFAAFGADLTERALGATRMLQSLDRLHDTAREVVIVHEGDRSKAEPLLAVLRRTFLPNRVLLVVSESEATALAASVPLLEGKRVMGEGATAYVCERGRCERPTNDPAVFAEQLAQVRPL
ncbi:MAG: thioredoxin domain-containing protein [Deltaproteobacteria bacterium]|nr:thioredoxin domain-containing protein [Deltaproteobacteria bacterium]